MPKFNSVKHQVLKCLYEGYVLHESRDNIDIKNLLEIGELSVEELADIIKHSRGGDYESSPHHMDVTIDVHVLKTRYQQQFWYIKWYFLEPDAVFISVHQ